MNRATCLAVLAATVLIGCSGPSPYDIPPRPQSVPPGSPPQVPSQPIPIPGEPGEPEAEEEEMPPPAPRSREYQLGTASRALVSQAQAQAASGNYAVAAGSIERALRIEPSNPLLWIELGKLRQAEGNYAQAEGMGRKALSLATGDAKAQAAAWQLVAESLRARGRVQQAEEAEAAAHALASR